MKTVQVEFLKWRLVLHASLKTVVYILIIIIFMYNILLIHARIYYHTSLIVHDEYKLNIF